MEQNSKAIEVEKLIVHSKRAERLEAEPDFKKDAVYFYPIPAGMQGLVQKDQFWRGKLGAVRSTGKKDKRGAPIYVRYFIPIKNLTQKKEG